MAAGLEERDLVRRPVERSPPRGRLFRKYVVLFIVVVSTALTASGLLEIWFSYREQIASLASAGAALIDARRIALNPDCGFAPEAAEPPTIDEAYEKLKRLVAAAAAAREKLVK